MTGLGNALLDACEIDWALETLAKNNGRQIVGKPQA